VPDLDPTGHGHPDSVPNQGFLVPLSTWRHVRRGPGQAGTPQEVTVDSVPSGEVDIRRDLTACATDGEIGQVQGLVVEPGGHQVTHVLLREGHMWGRKEVAIPRGSRLQMASRPACH
jgi:hypothetical protein